MTLPSRTDGPHRPSLSALHHRTIALRLAMQGKEITVKGRGVYEDDEALGHLLRIELPADAGCHFVLVESSWNGEVESGKELGCDYLIRLS